MFTDRKAVFLSVGGVSTSEDRMQVVFEELQDLRGVWSELSRIWAQIDEIREKPWLSVQPRKLRQQLDTLMAQLKELPARLRQYSSYEYVKKLLQSYAKVRESCRNCIYGCGIVLYKVYVLHTQGYLV
jgi:dynein heavy chain 1